MGDMDVFLTVNDISSIVPIRDYKRLFLIDVLINVVFHIEDIHKATKDSIVAIVDVSVKVGDGINSEV